MENHAGASGRKRGLTKHSVEDQALDQIAKEAEARLAARRQARVEAREIRMRELERVQKEQQEEGGDRLFDLHAPPRSSTVSPRERPISNNSYHSSRRSSEDSMEDVGLNHRDIRHELKEVEEKFRKAMIANAQLDNEKAAFSYQVELLKDKLEDLEEAHSQLSREHRERCREHEALKRATIKLKDDLNMCRQCLEERDLLIADYGLVIVGGEVDEKGELTPRSLVSAQSAQILESAGEGSLDVRLKTLAKEKNELLDEVRHVKLELEEERNRRRNDKMLSNGPVGDEIQQTLNDYRFRLQKADQETSTLQANVARLESQVIRYKSAAETSEKAEDELKVEKRKLQREHRESIARIEELETANSHLQRRMDKLKNAKSTLLKEL